MAEKGKFITFEGVEGAGKSTQIPLVSQWLTAQGIVNITTREPGGGELSELIRHLLLTQSMSSVTELLLMFAARKEHIDQVIAPALAAGQWVLCDRFTEATYAYQAFGRKIALDNIHYLESLVQGVLRPDRTFWFDLPVIEGLKRANKRGALDRFEQEDLIFFERVAQGYEYLYQQRPEQIVRLDARQSVAQLTTELTHHLIGLRS